MNLQDIRKYYEYPVHLTAATCRASNSAPRTPSNPAATAIHKFCLARLQFGEMAEQAVGCGPLGNKRAVFCCRIPRPEEVSVQPTPKTSWECVICAFHELKGRGEHQRPRLHFTRRTALTSSRAFSFGLQIPQDLD